MGFPKECVLPLEYNFAGPDTKLDMVVALLAMGKDDYNGIVSWGSCPCPFNLQCCAELIFFYLFSRKNALLPLRWFSTQFILSRDRWQNPYSVGT